MASAQMLPLRMLINPTEYACMYITHVILHLHVTLME